MQGTGRDDRVGQIPAADRVEQWGEPGYLVRLGRDGSGGKTQPVTVAHRGGRTPDAALFAFGAACGVTGAGSALANVAR